METYDFFLGEVVLDKAGTGFIIPFTIVGEDGERIFMFTVNENAEGQVTRVSMMIGMDLQGEVDRKFSIGAETLLAVLNPTIGYDTFPEMFF